MNEKLRAQKKSAKSRMQREEAKSLRLRQVGFRILTLAQHEEKASDKWLSVKLPSLQADERYKLLTEIVDDFISLDIENIIRMLEPIAHNDKVLSEEAKAAIASCDLHSWVCQQNIQKGLAPTVGAIIRQRVRVNENAGYFIPDEPNIRKGRWASYKWISRWRKKWRMPKGKIQDRDAPTPSEITEKVRVVQFPSRHKISQCLTPILFCKGKAEGFQTYFQPGRNSGDLKMPTMVPNSSKKRVPNSGPVLWAAVTSAIQSWVSKNNTKLSQKVLF